MNLSKPIFAVAALAAFTVALPSSPARADEKRREELALKVVTLTGGTDLGSQVAAGFLSQLEPVFPTVPDALWAEIATTFSSKEIIELSVPVYVKHFSEEELAALAEFYQSPVGQKLIGKMPIVMRESMVVQNEFEKRKAAEIFERLRAEGHEPKR